MQQVTLALAILLCAGFVAAKVSQLCRLPSVTGYILAGLLLGPSGFNLVSEAAIDVGLGHFTQIALMLIAFGIGEHVEIKKLGRTAKSIGLLGLAEAMGAFLLVSSGAFLVALVTNLGGDAWGAMDLMVMALLLGAVAVATAPATTLHVMRELQAAGPLTTTLMAVVAFDNGLAIILFGMALAMARQLTGVGGHTVIGTIGASLIEIVASLLIGVLTGLLIDFLVKKMKSREEMLTAGLALLLMCGEVTRLLNFSSLLAGIAAGFTIVNRDYRDVRIFRALNAFEAPVYVLFFTLAGARLEISALASAGWIGLAYFFCRGLGKILGANIGARLSRVPTTVQRYLGLALVPQAGVAIGLVFLIMAETGLDMYAAVITPVVLASVVLAELIGPVLARLAVNKAGEAQASAEAAAGSRADPERVRPGVKLVPWTWEKLQPSPNPNGAIIFGVSHLSTVAGLARMSTIIADYHGARPLAARVILPGSKDNQARAQGESQLLFAVAGKEVEGLGYQLDTEIVQARDVATGLVAIARHAKPLGVVLGHPINWTAQEFQKVVEAVARNAPCQIIVARFAGLLHTERILVPTTTPEELTVVRDVVRALSRIGKHRITLLHLLPSYALTGEVVTARSRLFEWARIEKISPVVYCQAVSTEAPLQTIVQEADRHDLLVMAAPRGSHTLQRLFFGSLAVSVSEHCHKPMLMVYAPRS